MKKSPDKLEKLISKIEAQQEDLMSRLKANEAERTRLVQEAEQLVREGIFLEGKLAQLGELLGKEDVDGSV